MSIELTVTIKDVERSFKQKFLHYEPFQFGNPDDPFIKKCIEEALVNFKGEPPEDITVRAMMILR